MGAGRARELGGRSPAPWPARMAKDPGPVARTRWELVVVRLYLMSPKLLLIFGPSTLHCAARVPKTCPPPAGCGAGGGMWILFKTRAARAQTEGVTMGTFD